MPLNGHSVELMNVLKTTNNKKTTKQTKKSQTKQPFAPSSVNFRLDSKANTVMESNSFSYFQVSQ